MNDLLIDMKNITIYFKGLKICQDINLQIKKGEIYPIMYSEPGLKYFFRYLLGLRGEVDGSFETPGLGEEWREDAAFIPHSGGYYPKMTVKEQLEFFKVIYPAFSFEKARELTHQFRLPLDRRMIQFPDYQRKLILILGMIATGCRLILFEEPFNLMPEVEILELKEIFSLEVEKGRTILFSFPEGEGEHLFKKKFILTPEGILPYVEKEKKEEEIKGKEKGFLKKIPVWKDEKATLIDYDRIRWISTSSGKCTIHTENGDYEINVLLRDLEKRFECPPFFRCHRSFLVNLNHVDEVITWFNGTYNLKIGENEIPVSRSKAKELDKLLGI